MNRVQPGSFLTLHYRLTAPDGTTVVDTFADKPATLSLGTGQLAAAMEARLLGMEEGARAVFALEPGEAFGEHNPQMVQRVARRLLDELGQEEPPDVGDVISFPTPDGQGSFAGLVRELGDDWLLFDFNHPLAGRALSFEVQLIGVL